MTKPTIVLLTLLLSTSAVAQDTPSAKTEASVIIGETLQLHAAKEWEDFKFLCEWLGGNTYYEFICRINNHLRTGTKLEINALGNAERPVQEWIWAKAISPRSSELYAEMDSLLVAAFGEPLPHVACPRGFGPASHERGCRVWRHPNGIPMLFALKWSGTTIFFIVQDAPIAKEQP
jgi:hypothetical protein